MATSSCHVAAMLVEVLSLPGPFWGPLLAGAGGCASAALLGWLILLGERKSAGRDLIRPGAMHWAGLVLSAGLATLMAYVVGFVGSSRADGAMQMQILRWLALAFALGALFSLVRMRSIVRAAIGWRGGTVRFRTRGGGMIERPIAGIISLSETGGGWFIARFGDGTALRIDPCAKGAEALLHRISDVAGKGRPAPA